MARQASLKRTASVVFLSALLTKGSHAAKKPYSPYSSRFYPQVCGRGLPNAILGQNDLLCLDDTNTGLEPTTFYPWTHRPFCAIGDSDNPWCVYTNADTSGGSSASHGISIITMPELASGSLSLLEHLPPTPSSSTEGSRPYKVTPVKGKGLGAIATKKISKGETILVDRAMVLSAAEYPADISGNQVLNLLGKAVDQLPDPEVVYKLSTKGQSQEEGFLDVENLLLSNSFLVDVGEQSMMALFGHLARFNHACEPNTNMRFSEKTLAMTVVASKDIEPGEELTISYIDATLPYKERQTTLQQVWGFKCTCPLCSLSRHQRQASDERRTEIQTLKQQAIVFAQAGNFNEAIGASEQLIRLIDQEGLTFRVPDVYDMPAKLYYQIGNLVKAREYYFLSLMALQDLGVEEGSAEEEKAKMLRQTLDKIDEELTV